MNHFLVQKAPKHLQAQRAWKAAGTRPRASIDSPLYDSDSVLCFDVLDMLVSHQLMICGLCKRKGSLQRFLQLRLPKIVQETYHLKLVLTA